MEVIGFSFVIKTQRGNCLEACGRLRTLCSTIVGDWLVLNEEMLDQGFVS
jgi:hypothetical protein